jgi:hypothetical protein
MIKVSDNVTVDEVEPEVGIMAMHHAREWMTVEVTMYYLNHLVNNYGSDPRATWMVDNREIFLVPIVNPDGYVFSQEVQNMWRKNRRDNGDGTHGVDPNRNYNGSQNGDPIGEWGGVGSYYFPGFQDHIILPQFRPGDILAMGLQCWSSDPGQLLPDGYCPEHVSDKWLHSEAECSCLPYNGRLG